MVFICEECGREFKYKHAWQGHLKKKNPCVKDIPEVKPKNMCDWCHYTFAHKSGLSRHHKTCPVKKNKNKLDEIRKEKEEKARADKLVNVIEKLTEKIDELTNDNQKLHEKLNEIRNDKQKVDINFRSKYVQNNGVIINNAISPNMAFADKEIVEKLLDSNKLEAPLFLSYETYYGNHPENHSLHITNCKTKEGLAYRNGRWTHASRADVSSYLLNALYTGYDHVIRIGSTIDKYADHVLLAEIKRNQNDDKNIALELNKLLFLAVQVAKKNDINPHFIDEDIKRGKAALKMIEDVLDDGDIANVNDGNGDVGNVGNERADGADAGNGKEEAE